MALAIGADEKKKLYILGGLLAAIGVVVVVLYLPKGGSKTSTTPSAIPTPAAKIAKAPGVAGAGATGAVASTAPGTVNAASLVSVSSFRDDPFAPFACPPLPVLPPLNQSQSSSPPADGPVEIPSPEQVNIVPDSTIENGGSLPAGGSLPPMGVGSGTASRRPLADMPPITLPMRANIPTTPAPLSGSPSAGGILESPNKRVSGVIIGDSVRALIEITDGDAKTTRIVQPGDEIDGIRILRIERATQAGRAVTRVIIRENGEERSIILKPAPKVATSGTPGIPGAPGRTGRP